MKRPIVTLMFCFLTLAAIAQTSRGTISLGGTFTIETYKEDVFNTDFGAGEFKSTEITFAPTAGYFLADGMELGLNLSLSSLKRKFEPEDGDDQELPDVNETAIGPYFKYYMFTSNEKFAFTLNASLLFGFVKVSPEQGDDLKGTSMQFTISPGFTYFFTDKIGLDFELQGIGYRKEDINTDPDAEYDESSTFIFGVSSFNPSLGFKYYFGK